jgi:hypothetical protein
LNARLKFWNHPIQTKRSMVTVFTATHKNKTGTFGVASPAQVAALATSNGEK